MSPYSLVSLCVALLLCLHVTASSVHLTMKLCHISVPTNVFTYTSYIWIPVYNAKCSL